jgi:hypothetical protein
MNAGERKSNATLLQAQALAKTVFHIKKVAHTTQGNTFVCSTHVVLIIHN